MNVDSAIRELNPAPTTSLLGPDSIEGRAIFERLTRAPAPRHRHLVVGGMTLATLGVAGAAIVASTLVPGSPARPTSAAAATLARLSDVALAQPAANPPGPGQYEYTESIATYEACGEDQPSYCYFQPQSRQIWIGSDGSGRILESFGAPSFVTPADKSGWESVGSPAISTATSDTTFGPHTMSDGPSDLANLPTDPDQLGALLVAGKVEGGSPGPAEEFVQIGDLLRETDASPALRSALYQVTETIPGVTLLGTVTDHSGRTGVGIAYDSAGVRHEYIFDPSTSALLGEQDVSTRAGAGNETVPAGTVLGWAVYLSSGIVGSLSDTPSGTAPPAPPVSCVAVTTPPTMPEGSIPALTPVAGSGVYPATCTNSPK